RVDYYHGNPPIACFIIKLGVSARPTGTPRRKEWEVNTIAEEASLPRPAYAGNYMLPLPS
ncbi:MAG: hypothetical protein OEZ00_09445, partial [Dehalococcoidia bacterium]|nr:hypothetical protein [Dehalococcoidia bacterium]